MAIAWIVFPSPICKKKRTTLKPENSAQKAYSIQKSPKEFAKTEPNKGNPVKELLTQHVFNCHSVTTDHLL